MKKVTPGGNDVIYIGGTYEVELNGSTVVKTTLYYPSAGAVRVIDGGGNTLYYTARDHLGSASVTLNTSGAIVANGEQRYYPFGESRIANASMPTDRLYTGQRFIDGLGGLYHYNARFYLPKLGRFISADTIVPESANPQANNRYSYVMNSPLVYTDPSGYCRTKDGEFVYAEDCTAGEFYNLSWENRLLWLNMFTEKHLLDPWFGDIKGTLEYFGKDKEFSNVFGWASYADAYVIQAIQNGMRLDRGDVAVGGARATVAATGWRDFFRHLRSGNDLEERIRIRLVAEQMGVDYAVEVSGGYLQSESMLSQIRIGLFLSGANEYRRLGVNARTPVARFGALGEHGLPGFTTYHFLRATDPRTSPNYIPKLTMLVDPVALFLYGQSQTSPFQPTR